MPDDLVEAPADEQWVVEVDHTAYYRWLPVPERDVKAEEEERGLVLDATWPGYKMRRTTITEAVTTTTTVHVPQLRKVNADRKEAGLGPRSLHANLTKHLEDGPWPKHFPLESITEIRCSNKDMAAKLTSYFVGGDA